MVLIGKNGEEWIIPLSVVFLGGSKEWWRKSAGETAELAAVDDGRSKNLFFRTE